MTKKSFDIEVSFSTKLGPQNPLQVASMETGKLLQLSRGHLIYTNLLFKHSKLLSDQIFRLIQSNNNLS